MAYLNDMECCGTCELAGLIYTRTKYAVLHAANSKPCAFVIFTEAQCNDIPPTTYGKKLSAFIKDNGLGEVVETAEKLNPNSGNMLKVYVWAVDRDSLKTFKLVHNKKMAVAAKRRAVAKKLKLAAATREKAKRVS